MSKLFRLSDMNSVMVTAIVAKRRMIASGYTQLANCKIARQWQSTLAYRLTHRTMYSSTCIIKEGEGIAVIKLR